MTNLLNIENVTKSFGVRPLLDGVSLGVGAGERIGVVGPNSGSVDLLAFTKKRLGRTVAELEAISQNTGEWQLLQRVMPNPGPGDRVGLAGGNSPGKTTLLRLPIGENSPTPSKCKQGQTVAIVHPTQERHGLGAKRPGCRTMAEVR